MYRFWNSGGLMTKESIETQVAQIKQAGAGGFEANQLVGIPRLSRALELPWLIWKYGENLPPMRGRWPEVRSKK